ncbi:hypothetical protein B9479_006498, partial [Cryptococcus floricola]
MAMVREEELAVQESSLADLLKDPDARAAVKVVIVTRLGPRDSRILTHLKK